MGRYLQLGDNIFRSPLQLARYIAKGLRGKDSDKDIDEELEALTESVGLLRGLDYKTLMKKYHPEEYDVLRDNWEVDNIDRICEEISDKFWGFDDETVDGDSITIYGYDLIVVEEPTEEDEAAFNECLDNEIILK